MLSENIIERIVADVMSKYEHEHHKIGISKSDVIEVVKKNGGDMNDARKVMVESAIRIMREIPGIRELYE